MVSGSATPSEKATRTRFDPALKPRHSTIGSSPNTSLTGKQHDAKAARRTSVKASAPLREPCLIWDQGG
jgi:hypothetical protein